MNLQLKFYRNRRRYSKLSFFQCTFDFNFRFINRQKLTDYLHVNRVVVNRRFVPSQEQFACIISPIFLIFLKHNRPINFFGSAPFVLACLSQCIRSSLIWVCTICPGLSVPMFQEQSDLDLHHLPWPVCPNVSGVVWSGSAPGLACLSQCIRNNLIWVCTICPGLSDPMIQEQSDVGLQNLSWPVCPDVSVAVWSGSAPFVLTCLS